jgi:flagellar protein FliS
MAFHSHVLNQYQQVKVEGGVQAADPHRLVAMLLEGAKEKIHGAKLRILHNHGVKDVQEKGALIGGSIAIVDALRASLDMEKGGEIAANLEQLYDYMTRRLLEANLRNDVDALAEVAGLLGSIEEAWNAIAPKAPTPAPDDRPMAVSLGA